MMYLAAPYTHTQAWVREARVRVTAQVAGELARAFIHDWVFAPTLQGHAVAPHLPLYIVRDHAFWMRQCEQALAEAERMILLPLPGWLQSKGIRQELQFCWSHGIRVTMLDCRSWAQREYRRLTSFSHETCAYHGFAVAQDALQNDGLLWALAQPSPTPAEQMEECGQVVRGWQVVELGKVGKLGKPGKPGKNGTDKTGKMEKEADNG